MPTISADQLRRLLGQANRKSIELNRDRQLHYQQVADPPPTAKQILRAIAKRRGLPTIFNLAAHDYIDATAEIQAVELNFGDPDAEL